LLQVPEILLRVKLLPCPAEIEMKKVAVTTTSFCEFDPKPLELLSEAGFSVQLNSYKRQLQPSEVWEIAGDAVGMIAGTEPLNGNVLEKLPRLKVLSRCGAGIENVDLDFAKKNGIQVCSTPSAPTLAVAELTVGFILSLLRRTALMDRQLRTGVWKKEMGSLLSGKRVGIVGFGRIGRKVADLLTPFETEIAFYDTNTEAAHPVWKIKTLPELLGWADIVTLHCPSSPGKTLIGRNEIQRMKKGSWIINASRGGLIDEQALYEALQSKHLQGAALDVFSEEPYKGKLTELSNVLLTPHVGSYAKESRVEMELQSVRNLLEAFQKCGQPA
jgi:D-3-phosphoglycerate dehydrogenase